MGLIDTTMGAVLVCTFVSFLWFGVVINQACTYYSSFPNDRVLFKLVTAACVLMCVLDTSFDASWCYRWLVSNYGNMAVLAKVPLELPATILLLSTSTLTVQTFYAWRLHMIAPSNYIVPIAVTLCSLLQFASMLYITPMVIIHPMFADIETYAFPVAWVWLGASAAGDIIITSSMVYYLQVKARGIRASQGIFQQIVYRCIQSNAISLVSQVVVIVLFRMKTAGFWYLITIFTVPKTLTFSLFASLNSRRSSETAMDAHGLNESGAPGSTLRLSNPQHGSRRDSFATKRLSKRGIYGADNPCISNLSVHVEQEVTVDVEQGDAWAPTVRQLKTVNVILPALPVKNLRESSIPVIPAYDPEPKDVV